MSLSSDDCQGIFSLRQSDSTFSMLLQDRRSSFAENEQLYSFKGPIVRPMHGVLMKYEDTTASKKMTSHVCVYYSKIFKEPIFFF